MTKSLIFCSLLVLLAVTLSAQEYTKPYEYPASSAPATVTWFGFDIVNSLYMDSMSVNKVIYRDQSETVWSNTDMDVLYRACSTVTYAGSIEYEPGSDLLEWYLRSENDTAVISQSPRNSDDLFPVADYLLADLGADAIGDTEEGGGDNVDITHCYGSYSDTKLYFRLDNNGGGFPTSGGFLTYYLYMVGVVNPDMTDSVAYLLLYAENPLYSTGLYALDLTDSSLASVGSVTASVSGNSLSLSCDIADLVAQSGWSEWPPESEFVGVAPLTATAMITDIGYNDFGKTALLIPSSHLLDFAAANTAPSLTSPVVDFDNDGLVTVEITYTDSDNHLPVMRRMFFDGVAYDLMACEKDYENGAVFGTELTVSESRWYGYSFEFSDGVDTVRTSLDSVWVQLGCCVGETVGNMDCEPGIVDMGDLTILIDHLFISLNPLCCLEEGDVDLSGQPDPGVADVDMSDLTVLIDHLFIGLTPLPSCP